MESNRGCAVGVVDLPRGWSICTLGRSGLDGEGGREKNDTDDVY